MESFKILSWNIRGFKILKNRRNLKSLVSKWDPAIVCIQKTMMSVIGSKDLEIFWPHKEVKAVYQSANGHSGGILCCWDPSLFEIKQFHSINACLGISFKDIKCDMIFHIFIIYGPHSSTEKVALWNNLSALNTLTLDSPPIFIGYLNYP